MTYVKINGVQYPAVISGHMKDRDWNDRESKTIHLEMTHDEALKLFVSDSEWSILYQADGVGEDGKPFPVEEYDNHEYSVAGPVTDNRDGTVSVKMGKPTAEELLAVLTGEVE